MNQRSSILYWEHKFESEKTLWGFQPADSAIMARDQFLKYGIRKILIPGIGYGRNAMAFLNHGFDITGIEISQEAIRLAGENGMAFTIHCGSVVDMPFDDNRYEGIFCYALIHLLSRNERKFFLLNCFNQLTEGGWMIFTMVTKTSEMYGNGRLLSKDRFEISKGLNVFFFDEDAVRQEFGKFGLVSYSFIEEPVKHIKDTDPLKLIYVLCRKS